MLAEARGRDRVRLAKAMGDRPDDAFLEATQPLRAELRLHCYRMLGSSHDSDDMVQETLLRAWRARRELTDPKQIRAWLYRIATNACIDELRARPRRALPTDVWPPAADPTAPIAPPVDEAAWLEPIPDSWWPAAPPDPSPLSRYSFRESVALAFVAALQLLTPVQRAALVLRDVIGMSAAETARALGVSNSAANGALFRARRAIRGRSSDGELAERFGADDIDETLIAKYVRALEDADVDALVDLLREAVTTTMPPSPTWIHGIEGHRAFFGRMFASIPRRSIRLGRLAVNGGVGFAFYRATSAGEPPRLRAIEVVSFRGGRVARIDHFMAQPVLRSFGVAESLPW